MEIRHMQRDVGVLRKLFPDGEMRNMVTLFDDGDFGNDGAFFLPIETEDLNRQLLGDGPYPEGLKGKLGMNQPPEPCPSLYCNLTLLNDPDGGHSYLAWDGTEKSYYITDWIKLITGWLAERGYHLDGKMFAVVEGGMSYYTITVIDGSVIAEEFVPEATYEGEINNLLDKIESEDYTNG